MNSLIIDLQKDIFENNEDIETILSKALVISDELELKEFNDWINLELNGYKDNLDKLPKYRVLECELRADFMEQVGWDIVKASKVPITDLPGDVTEKLMEVPVYQSILEVIHICEGEQDSVHFSLDVKVANLLKEYMPNALRFYRVCPIFKLETIVSHVKNEILKWCSELKKNDIYGDSYYFTPKEREDAKSISYNIFLNNSSIHVGDNNINITYKQEILNNLNDIKSILDENDVDGEKILEINNQIVIIEDELEKVNPDVGIMEDAAKYMKNFVTQVMAGAIANLLLKYIDSVIQVLLSM